jgi:hypothetical protein
MTSFDCKQVHGITFVDPDTNRELFGCKIVGPEYALRMWLPYLLQKVEDPIGGWVLLNRHYKPLGHSANKSAVYESIPRHMRVRFISKSVQLKLRCEGGNSQLNKMIFLYHDGSVPYCSSGHWSDYQKRLQIISKLMCFGD